MPLVLPGAVGAGQAKASSRSSRTRGHDRLTVGAVLTSSKTALAMGPSSYLFLTAVIDCCIYETIANEAHTFNSFLAVIG